MFGKKTSKIDEKQKEWSEKLMRKWGEDGMKMKQDCDKVRQYYVK